MDNPDIIQLISHYLDYNEFNRVSSALNVKLKLYLDYVEFPSKEQLEKDYLIYKLEHDKCCDCDGKIHNIKENKVDWASRNGHLEVVKYLCSKGEECSEFAVDWASREGHLELVKYLCSQGIVDVVYTENSVTWASVGGYLEIIKYLNSVSEIPEDTKKNIMTNACRYGKLELVKYLESENVPYAGEDIAYACAMGQLEIVKFIIHNEKDSKIWYRKRDIQQNDISLALGTAFMYGQFEIIKYVDSVTGSNYFKAQNIKILEDKLIFDDKINEIVIKYLI